MIHPTADVQTVSIGEGTKIWQFCVVLKQARIGKNCNVCAYVLIENDVVIGDNVTIKSGVQVWDGVTISDNAFIGPNVTFTNDVIPRSKASNWKLSRTYINTGASIGANSTIIAGHVLGEYSFVGAGSVVTKDIPAYTVWFGNPAVQHGYITRSGIMLDMDMKDKFNIMRSLTE